MPLPAADWNFNRSGRCIPQRPFRIPMNKDVIPSVGSILLLDITDPSTPLCSAQDDRKISQQLAENNFLLKRFDYFAIITIYLETKGAIVLTIDACIRRMTLQEKAALLQGKTNWTTWNIPRLGIPSIFVADGPHGLRKQAGAADHLGLNESIPATCFPTAATMANSWNPELGQELGRALGQEAAANDVHVVLGPGLNMKRSPLCGRNLEYFSEDPYLAGKMAAAYIRGIQENGVGACPKHFAVNSQELRRMSVDAVVDERTLREIYLTGFEIAVKEGKPKTIMTSYNSVNGTYANENTHLLKDILRGEWGFDGFVMTDWGGSNDHAAGVAAGSSLEMPYPGEDSALTLIRAVREGKLPESVLDDRIRELLQVVFDTTEAVVQSPKIYDRHDHHRLAERCAADAIVLLENDGVLPLQPRTKVAVIGEFAEKPRYQGAGSSLVNPNMLTNFRDWLHQTPLKMTDYVPGYRRGQQTADKQLLEAAVAAAKAAEVVLLCIGLDETAESEGADRTHMALPQAQLAVLEAVCKANPNVVLILSGGSPFILPQTGYRAALHGYLGGQAGAAAMVKALVGEINPSGHLAETWPLSLEDTPTARYYPGKEFTAEHREGPYIGYRYYETVGAPVRYPFGHGLSYTSFAYSDLQADGQKVSFTLTNTGAYDGAEVAQVYITCRTGKVFRAKKELKGFQKVFLKAGESRRVTVALDDKAFRYFNTLTNRFETETANYDILVGSSVRDIRLNTTIRVFGTDVAVPSEAPQCYRTGNITQVSDEDFGALLGRPVPDGHFGEELTILDTISRFTDAKNPMARWIGKRVGRSIEKSRAKGDPAPTMLYVYNLPIRGLAQMTGGYITRQMAEDVLLWANGHGFRGLYRFGRDFRKGRKAAKQFRQSLKHKTE